MKFKAYARRALKHPLVVIPPLILVLAFGWQQYTYAGRELNVPDGNNILSNGDFAQLDSTGMPTGWTIDTSGSSNHTVGTADGYVSGRSYQLSVNHYQSGDVMLSSPKTTVTAGKTYLFKGYYDANTSFSLLVRMYHSDGSSSLQYVQTYQTTSGSWSTTSDAFAAGTDVTAVQFVYRMYGNGHLELNGLYLEPNAAVYIAPAPAGNNVIPNSQLASSGSVASPVGWSTYDIGANATDFSYLAAGSDTAYLRTHVSDYISGEAKWQYQPQSVQAHEYYMFNVAYRSDTHVSIVAEYVLQDGTRQYQTVADLNPAGDWTTVSYKFEVPEGAKTMFVSLPLKANGTVDTRDYQLVRITRSGPAAWNEPAVSLTFDSGRQSQYQNAYPLLRQRNYAATFYVNPATIETPSFMTASQLTTLANDGSEIGARGYDPDDMTAINENALSYQLQKGRDYLGDAGFQTTDLAVPFGRSDSEVQYYARQDYTTLRGTDSGINTRQNIDPYDLKVLNISNATTLQDLDTALQTAQAEHGWLILVYQDIGAGTTGMSSADQKVDITQAAFAAQLDAIHKSGINVTPVATAYAALRQQE